MRRNRAAVDRQRPIESGGGFGRYDAARGGRQRLAEAFLPIGVFAQKPAGILPCPHGFFLPAETHVHGRQNLPGATLIGPASEMRLDLSNHNVIRPRSG